MRPVIQQSTHHYRTSPACRDTPVNLALTLDRSKFDPGDSVIVIDAKSHAQLCDVMLDLCKHRSWDTRKHGRESKRIYDRADLRYTGFSILGLINVHRYGRRQTMVHLSSRVRVAVGDITRLDVDAVVTAANCALLGGGGVDGAVHSAAGPELVAASRRLAPCPEGQARMTAGFKLRASHVIHAVGPIYRDGESGEGEALESGS